MFDLYVPELLKALATVFLDTWRTEPIIRRLKPLQCILLAFATSKADRAVGRCLFFLKDEDGVKRVSKGMEWALGTSWRGAPAVKIST